MNILITCSNPDCTEVNPQPLDNFHRNKKGKHGRLARCKVCINIQNKIYAQTAVGKKAKRRHQRTDKGKRSLRLAQRRYRLTQKGKDAAKRNYANEKSKRGHLKRAAARSAVRLAVINGKLPHISTLPCRNNPEHQATHYHHHNGYDWAHRIDVIPVCASCHYQLDRINKDD